VNIMAIKRFVADWAWKHPEERRIVVEAMCSHLTEKALNGKKVAIVGAGPAGLTCAQELSRQGFQVTIFEALPVPGGMLRAGVPVYRLPPEVVQREIDDILALGIELKLNHRVNDVEALLEDYDAVFVTIGAHAGIRLPIPGADLPNVHIATEFLRMVNLPETTTKMPEVRGKRVLVLGGGNVAIDSATNAVRMGAAWVGMTCLESRSEMPAHDWEISDAEEEGIKLYPSRTFKEITCQDDQVTGVRTVNIDFRGFTYGKPDFDEIPGTEEIIAADIVIFAIGQHPQSTCLKQVKCQANGRIVVDPETMSTNVPGIYAGGDAVTGTAFIVDAIAAGRRAARSIEAFFNGYQAGKPQVSTVVPGIASLSAEEVFTRISSTEVSPAQRIEPLKRCVNERTCDFREVYECLSADQAQSEAARCLRCGICSECNQCVYTCQADAINHQDTDQLLELQVGALLLTPGLEPMPGDVRPEYGYGRYPNVITSLQFERMLSASGPSMGVVKRPSDGTHPHRIAWIQCVGSRDCTSTLEEYGRVAYCSSICCMYATKEAIIAREHDTDIQPTIFYMDIRSFGKGFETYIERASQEHGVRFIRCMISAVKEVPTTHNLRLGYVTYEGQEQKKPVFHEELFDLVVLSVGMRPSPNAHELALRLGLDVNEYGFVDTIGSEPTRTIRDGIYAAGAFIEPKDIPESVIEASCAAAQISALLAEARGTLTRTPVYPPERDTSDEFERVGVFICHCGINIGAVVDVPAVVEYAQSLPGVVHAEHNLYTCSQDTQELIAKQITEYGLNRVVVASCTPRTHEPLFQDTLRQAGLNPHLFEMANIREQDSWVHRIDPQPATAKAKQLVAMAVAKARKLRSLSSNVFEVNPRALVIGGGLAGMTAALSISRQGYDVSLVERKSELGGNLNHIYIANPGSVDPQNLLKEILSAVLDNPRIHVLTGAEILDHSGYTGHFSTRIMLSSGTVISLEHGTTIVTTGGRETIPVEYLYNQHPRVLTQRELETLLHQDPSSVLDRQSFIMIQCVGSRNDDHPYCSRVCCTQALKNSLAIKQLNPNTRVVILYRDIRSYGFREFLYRQARQAGVIFLEYDPEKKPLVKPADKDRLELKIVIQPEDDEITLKADWLVLSTGIEAEASNSVLAQILKVPLDESGFFLEAHVKLRPVDFAAEGIYLAGLAHSPRLLEETIAQANAAAIRAVRVLSKPNLQSTPIIASVNPKLCAACGLCVEVCPYGARILEPGMLHAEVIEVLCQGCGACVTACPNKASRQKGFDFTQVFGMLEAAVNTPKQM